MNLSGCHRLLLISLFFIGCGEQPSSERKSQSAGQSKTLSTPNDTELSSNPTGDIDTNTGDFFKDSQDFEVSDIASGLMPCGGSGSKRALTNYNIKPWPEEMKAFLSQEMAKFPVSPNHLKSYFGGFYLSDTTLSDTIDENSNLHIDGLTCQNGKSGPLVVFVNYKVHVTERKKLGKLDRFQELTGLVDEYTLESAPDPTLATIFHELIHVIDFGEFTNGQTGEFNAARSDLADLSWSSIEDPLFDRISVAYLTERTASDWEWIRHHSIHEAPDFSTSLIQTSSEKLGEEFQYLAEETNFISPYAMTNVFEDLAASLEIYFMGTRYNKWPVRNIYDRNITSGLKDAEIVFTYDSGEIAKTSTDHRSKLCKMAKTVFGESCQISN